MIRSASPVGRLALALVTLLGCSRQDPLPGTVPELKDYAAKARDEAQAARTGKDPGKAEAAWKRADRAATAARELGEGKPEADAALLAEITRTADDARVITELAREDAELAARISGLKAKTYRHARNLALGGVLEGLAIAARHAAKDPGALLSPGIGEAADLGELISSLFSPPRPRLGTAPDWNGIAQDLEGLAATPPAAWSAFLAVAFALLGSPDLALVEVQEVDAEAFALLDTEVDPESRQTGAMLLRGFVYTLAGLPRLGAAELESLAEVSDAGKGKSQELLAGAHLLLAYVFSRLREWKLADRELALTLRVWPNNPAGVFLTGERLVASGEYEKAAESLELAFQGSDSEALARRAAERARAIRDGRTKDPALFLDNAFLAEVALHVVAESAKKSAAGRKVRDWVEAARGFGSRILASVSGDHAGK